MPATGSDVGRAGDDDRHRRQAVEGGARWPPWSGAGTPTGGRSPTARFRSTRWRSCGAPRPWKAPRPRGKDAGQGRGAAAARPGDWLGLPAGVVDFEPDPTLLVLFTPDETPIDWIRAGEALERVWLRATVRGLVMTPMSQLTEIALVRDLLIGFGNRHVPQTVVRIGYPLWPALAPPRWPLAELMVRTP
jgi:hypothetical protein